MTDYPPLTPNVIKNTGLKSNITERLIAALWFGLFGFLIIPFRFNSFSLALPLLLSAILLTIIFLGFGFLQAYKTLLLPVDQVSGFVTRTTAGTWFAMLGMGVAEAITDFTDMPDLDAMQLLLPIPFITVFFCYGIFHGYRLFCLPKILLQTPPQNYFFRVISALWFGLCATFAQHLLAADMQLPNALFIFLLAAYVGFTLGYQMIYFSYSLKFFLKSIVIGIIGSSYTLCVIILGLLAPMFFEPPTPDLLKSFVFSPMIDSVLQGIITLFSLFLMTSLFVIIPGIFSAIIFYLIISPFARKV